MAQQFESPFPHFIVSDFLSDGDLAEIKRIYERFEFNEQKTDLYNFYQTNELNIYEEVQWFIEKIKNQILEIKTVSENGNIDILDGIKNVKISGGNKNRSENINNRTNSSSTSSAKYEISMFGSLYKTGNYLLCHDDQLEGRLYAYCYYLEDYDSGDLIFYEKDCQTEAKRIKIKANTLLIFKVTNFSFHEVDFCKKDGRKAFTGWLNRKINFTNSIKSVEKRKLRCPIEIDEDEQFTVIPEISIPLEIIKEEVYGPFISRRFMKLDSKVDLMFDIEGRNVISTDFIRFRVGDYILLNDSAMNNKEVDLDLWYFYDDCDDSPIIYSNNDGFPVCDVPIVADSLFVVKREGLNVFVQRVKKEFRVIHIKYSKKII